MTVQEAINELKELSKIENAPLASEAAKMGAEALKKQVPMKPRTEDCGFMVHESCPVCDDSVDCGEIYCSYCGQRILREE